MMTVDRGEGVRDEASVRDVRSGRAPDRGSDHAALPVGVLVSGNVADDEFDELDDPDEPVDPQAVALTLLGEAKTE
jgi:hypothetical protein